ncbi:hypothetical protein VH567_12635 [Sphingomonas sp. 4RDLI-65]|uniref:hypothetical protein n=1 Tax=Sphingomonas sp. 4RDLI-65 TaxID=3111641 RepID=UPI003C2444E8
MIAISMARNAALRIVVTMKVAATRHAPPERRSAPLERRGWLMPARDDAMYEAVTARNVRRAPTAIAPDKRAKPTDASSVGENAVMKAGAIERKYPNANR